MAIGFKSNKPFILLHDYKWLRDKIGPFISMTDCLGHAWFMLCITCVFPFFMPSASDDLLQKYLHILHISISCVPLPQVVPIM